ncbi:hypothetical protein BDV93DRAFT_559503 [Ceratobasidium sp. AG-I]|nr:hypothetical protein BDV93DRAFT_559503 [Ceratobasidium sp. AG-I]
MVKLIIQHFAPPFLLLPNQEHMSSTSAALDPAQLGPITMAGWLILVCQTVVLAESHDLPYTA